LNDKGATMKHIKTTHSNGRHGPITSYYFKNGDREYIVNETELKNGTRNFNAFVFFCRETSNVFGNGSTYVSQSGWRRLPYGPKRRELEKYAEVLSLRARLIAS